ncbi:hypothetical protein TIFTF001_002882 [Ficus carica]|uniref:Neprosin PEP catalytic domain-containing protein n=1 Tax=Ficus carica TaxID=3494 RepID=A0AA87Z6U9_FICCA|nr:hypothetical protein TIFTF001_002882 [Ficus carica]
MAPPEWLWGGVATSGKDGMSPPMGNGHFPNGNDYNHFSYFTDVHYVDHENKMVIPTSDADTRGNVDKPSCYEFNNVQLKNQNGWGYSFTFGGPFGFTFGDDALKVGDDLSFGNMPLTEDGNTFDCVAITKQPALDHPLLNDHKVQMKPTSFPPRILEKSLSANETLEKVLGTTEECPVGTVPIQRTTKEHLVRARSLLDQPKKTNLGGQTVVSVQMKPNFRVYGAGGRVSIQKLALASDQFSSANVWIQSGSSTKLNYIAAGLMDRKTGNWWFMVSDQNRDVPVGYWPKSLFPYMRDGTQQVAWGGIAKAGRNGISPPMGNGHFPDGNYNHACYFSHVHYVNNKNTMTPPGIPYIFQEVGKPKCYGLKNDQLLHQKDLGYSFTFGGPGGKCG